MEIAKNNTAGFNIYRDICQLTGENRDWGCFGQQSL